MLTKKRHTRTAQLMHRIKPISTLLILVSLIAASLFFKYREAEATSNSVTDEALYAALETDRPMAYRIHGFRIGISKRANRNLFIKDNRLPKQIPVAFGMWMIEGEGRRILVDTGFIHQGMIDKWRIVEYQTPKAALASAGFQLKDVTDVVLTHTHWDHIGGLSLFYHPRLWMSKPVARSISKEGRYEKIYTEAKREGRLHKSSGITKVAPGVVTIEVGLHAPGMQILVVNRNGKRWVLCSDLAPLFANFERQRSTGQTSDPKQTLVMQQRILKWVDGDLTRVIPGHEPRIFSDNQKHVIVTESQSNPGSR